jgi:hypothetical protein
MWKKFGDDEVISKLVIGISPRDIHDWLLAKYTNVSEAKFVISEKSIKSFQDNYLDIYNLIQEDLTKTKAALSNNTEDQLELAVKNNKTPLVIDNSNDNKVDKFIVTPRQVQVNPLTDDPLNVNYLIYTPGQRLRIPLEYINHDMSNDLKRGCFVYRINRFSKLNGLFHMQIALWRNRRTRGLLACPIRWNKFRNVIDSENNSWIIKAKSVFNESRIAQVD